MLLGKGVMINWTNAAPEDRERYDAWQSHEHTPGRLAIPGFLRGRRYIAVDQNAADRQFLTLYEVKNLEVLTSEAYLAKANSPSPLTRATTPVVRDSVRGLARVRASHGPGVGGCALSLRLDPRAGSEHSLEAYLTREALPTLAQRADVCGAHWIVADQDASAMKPVERQGRPTDIPNWIVMIEGLTPAAVANAGNALLSDAQLIASGAAPAIRRDVYTLQYLHAASGIVG
jgi:hypothetical protein